MKILENISLKKLNTFGIDVIAKFYAEVSVENDIISLLNSESYNQNKHLILGGGSNILLTTDFDGIVIKNNIKGIKVIREDENNVWIKAYSGEIWHDFVLHCIAHNWGGIENLSLIPGTVGAAPMQNIGAYGVEIKDVFDSLTAIEKATGKLRLFNSNECKFGYRESIFKNELINQFIITSCTFKLTKKKHILNVSYGAIKDTLGAAQPSIKSISDAVIKIRQSKLPNPAEIGNSGSFFKNPTIHKTDFDQLKSKFKSMPGYQLPNNKVKIAAGWLIEQCGWKGKRFGEVGVHKKQALVLVNYGNGQGKSIAQLAQKIQKSVEEKFDIKLQTEVNFI
ncbi:MAG: UDP-N-acetylmuramate dehydrogenase [Cyclobacteriaceae bacterium]|nr:UDP-N-acetylmuramate dehydrogenase [Cyclobacteriaceae bacterium]